MYIMSQLLFIKEYLYILVSYNSDLLAHNSVDQHLGLDSAILVLLILSGLTPDAVVSFCICWGWMVLGSIVHVWQLVQALIGAVSSRSDRGGQAACLQQAYFHASHCRIPRRRQKSQSDVQVHSGSCVIFSVIPYAKASHVNQTQSPCEREIPKIMHMDKHEQIGGFYCS